MRLEDNQDNASSPKAVHVVAVLVEAVLGEAVRMGADGRQRDWTANSYMGAGHRNLHPGEEQQSERQAHVIAESAGAKTKLGCLQYDSLSPGDDQCW